MSDAVPPPFPELDAERRRLAFARACRDRMVERFERVDPHGAADEVTKDYVELTVAEALDDLRTPGAGDFFGRIDAEAEGERWYIGRRHIEDDRHDPVVVDWRAPVSAAFYRATVHDPLGLRQRRRFTTVDGDLTAYLDEHLDDPGAADVATGIPDPVLAEIGAARTGAMREIVATIQAEQDLVIRSGIDRCLVVQGGPGTGKTAVALHRAAFLLFEHRRRLSRDGVLVVGPSRVFLDYVHDVLPSLGERSVMQRTVLELCSPRVDVGAADEPGPAAVLGDARMLDVLQQAVRARVQPPTEAVRVPFGVRTLVFEADELRQWIETAIDGRAPMNRRRDGLRALAQRELLRRTGVDDAWARAPALRDALVAAWPAQQPIDVARRLLGDGSTLAAAAQGDLTDAEIELLTGGGRPGTRRRPWTPALQLVVDEIASLLNGPPATYGHVVVDEAQDHSAVGLRVIGRRARTGSLTVVGDLAQSTTPAGQRDWAEIADHLGVADVEVAHLTIGYRVPGPILDVANRLLPLTGVDSVASRSVRLGGAGPSVRRSASSASLPGEVAAEVVEVKRRHHLTGIVAPERWHADLGAALAERGLRGAGHVQHLGPDEVPLFSPADVKGLELDGVVVVNPHEVLDGTARGARLLYVAMTRAVQHLSFVADQPLPTLLTTTR